MGGLALHVEGNAIGGLGLDLQASYKQGTQLASTRAQQTQKSLSIYLPGLTW